MKTTEELVKEFLLSNKPDAIYSDHLLEDDELIILFNYPDTIGRRSQTVCSLLDYITFIFNKLNK